VRAAVNAGRASGHFADLPGGKNAFPKTFVLNALTGGIPSSGRCRPVLGQKSLDPPRDALLGFPRNKAILPRNKEYRTDVYQLLLWRKFL
jgi:hypothetical protein